MEEYRSYSDSDLLKLLSSGDGNAFAEVYERYWELLYRHARRMTTDDDMAKDVVQDVFITLWDKSSTMQFNISVSSYLYSVVRNKILNLYQKEKVVSKYLASLDDFETFGENITDHLTRERMLSQRIDQELELLPGKMRQVFELSRKHHKSYKEISELLHLSDKTVKKQVSNALKILRLKLGSFLSLF